jgi:hypothetical protein
MPRFALAAALLAAALICPVSSHAQAPRSRAEAAAFCYDVIRYTAGGGTDQRYRVCMADLGYPVAKNSKDERANTP